MAPKKNIYIFFSNRRKMFANRHAVTSRTTRISNNTVVITQNFNHGVELGLMQEEIEKKSKISENFLLLGYDPSGVPWKYTNSCTNKKRKRKKETLSNALRSQTFTAQMLFLPKCLLQLFIHCIPNSLDTVNCQRCAQHTGSFRG